MVKCIFSRLAVLLVAALVGINPLAAKSWTTVRIGIEKDFPPFSFRNGDGMHDGFDYKIARALCTEMNVECKFYFIPFSTAVVALNGLTEIVDFDGSEEFIQEPSVDILINSMTITDERKHVLAFTKPYYFLPHAILIRKDSGFTIKRSGDTAGRKVGILEGSAEKAYAKHYFTEADLETFYDAESLLSALSNGQIDMGLVDAIIVSDWAESDANQCCKADGYFSAQKALTQGVGIAVRQEDTDLLDMLNAALNQIQGDGTYQSIASEFFRFSIEGK